MEIDNNIFWGLVVIPGKRYETEVEEPFRITKACIDPNTAKDGKIASVYVECDNKDQFIISNLSLTNLNENLDLSFNGGETVCFKVEGCGTVHLTGNLLNDGRDMLDDGDIDDEIMEELDEKKKDKPKPKPKVKTEVNGNAAKKNSSKHNKAEDKNGKVNQSGSSKKKNKSCKQKWVKGREKKLFGFE